MKKITMLGAVAALVAAAPLSAQDMDGRWLPFVGCWEALGGEDDIGLLCFEPADGGVLLSNVVDGEVASSEFFAADGQPRDVNSEGCEGWEVTTFSQDGRRVFTETEFLCGTDEPRAGTGVMTFVQPNMWADIRTLETDGEPFVWVQEYRLASRDRLAEAGVEDPAAGLAMAVRTSRQSAAAPIDLGDVEEAMEVMDPKAVESWLVTKGDELDPSAADLVRLADAGVPENVIDAVVAVSHPERFVVASGGEVESYDAPRPTHYRGYMGYWSYRTPRWGLGYAPFGWAFGYDPMYYRNYYAGSYGYGYGYGYGYNYWGSRPGTIVIERSGGGSRGGSVINGQGYRRGNPSDDATRVRRAGGDVPSTGRSGSSSSGRTANPSSGSSGRSDSGRRAVRRRPGGGETQVSRSSSAPRPAARPSAPARRPAAARPSAPRRAPAAGSSSSSSSRDASRSTARRRGGSL